MDEIVDKVIRDNSSEPDWEQIKEGDLADKLLKIMTDEANKLGHNYIRQGIEGKDFIGTDATNESLFEKIQSMIDIDEVTSLKNYEKTDARINRIINEIKNNEDIKSDEQGHIWNESMRNIIKYLTEHYGLDDNVDDIDDTTTIPVKDGTGFSIAGVKKANAGYSFENNPYVVRDKNIDNQGYLGVRDKDRIDQVLNSQKNLQFTHTQTDGSNDNENQVTKYLRLIMPKYTRRVEVEDLNRNFWVIGQTVSALSAYLFDENSPIVKTFKDIIGELLQLWENVLFLWAQFKIQNTYSKWHEEAVYVPLSQYETWKNYDGFDEAQPSTWGDIAKRLEYLIYQYPTCNLRIVPIIRRGNYDENYYDTEWYPGLLEYDRNAPSATANMKGFKAKWWKDKAEVTSGDETITETNCLVINISHSSDDWSYENYIGCVNKNNNKEWIYREPMSDVKNSEEFIPSDYIAAVDTWVWFINKEPQVEVYDAIYRAVNKENNKRQVGLYNFGSFKNMMSDTITRLEKTAKSITSHKGFYLGELVSSLFETSLMDIDINIYDYNGIPVDTTGDAGDEEYKKTREQIKNYDKEIVSTAIGDDKGLQENLGKNIYLLLTSHSLNGFKDPNYNQYLDKFYYYNESEVQTYTRDDDTKMPEYEVGAYHLNYIQEPYIYTRYSGQLYTNAYISIPNDISQNGYELHQYQDYYYMPYSTDIDNNREQFKGISDDNCLYKIDGGNISPGKRSAFWHGGNLKFTHFFKRRNEELTVNNWVIVLTQVTYVTGVKFRCLDEGIYRPITISDRNSCGLDLTGSNPLSGKMTVGTPVNNTTYFLPWLTIGRKNDGDPDTSRGDIADRITYTQIAQIDSKNNAWDESQRDLNCDTAYLSLVTQVKVTFFYPDERSESYRRTRLTGLYNGENQYLTGFSNGGDAERLIELKKTYECIGAQGVDGYGAYYETPTDNSYLYELDFLNHPNQGYSSEE